MPRVFKRKSNLDKVLSIIAKELGREPSAEDMSNTLGEDISGWGRILNEKCKPSGEYHAKLNLVREFGLELARKSIYVSENRITPRQKTRNGNSVLSRTAIVLSSSDLDLLQTATWKEINKMQFANEDEKIDSFYKIFNAKCIEKKRVNRSF